jgi:T5SS/PEP-CTERM-associated repeat protein
MKKSSLRRLLFLTRSVVVVALLVICLPMLLNAADRRRSLLNKYGAPISKAEGYRSEYDGKTVDFSANPSRTVLPDNYIEVPLDQTVWMDGIGDWFNPSNWSAGVPNASTIAQINNGGTAEITSGIAAASRVELGIAAGDVGTVSTSGSGSLQDEGAMYIGEQGTGTVSITAGASVSSYVFVLGQTPGSNGTATVSGPGSTWTNLNFCFVGSDGTGTLNITNAGTVIASDTGVGAGVGSGIVVVDGAGSTWSHGGTIVIGGNAKGVGTVTISNGGTVFTGGVGGSFGSTIGYNSGSNGTVNVSGVGSTWTNMGPLAVSAGGDGTLNIMDGGAVSNSYGVLGSSISGGSGTVAVDGLGSTWTNNAELFVGAPDGVGMLVITGGSEVSDTNGFIAFGDENNHSTGSVDIDGAASTWTNSGNLYIGGSESGAGGNGVLHVNDGGTVSAASVTVWDSGTLSGNGSVQATNGTTIEGTLAPEQTLSIAGNVTLSNTASTLSTVTPDDADNVVVGGTANLDGDLEVTLTGGPFTVGTQYTLLQANSGLNGSTFSDVSINSPPGINPEITYDTDHVYLVIEPGGTPTPTPTVTPTVTPRPAPTPRSRPAPRPRPTPPR